MPKRKSTRSSSRVKKPRRSKSTLVGAVVALASVSSVSEVRLFKFRLRVKVTGQGVVNYFVEAPTQCSATRHSALRAEVEDIIFVERVDAFPTGVEPTFTTTLDCP